ncbi:hypothetical protein CPB84DRAFT_1199249, partial [Gymnopilus junonius]
MATANPQNVDVAPQVLRGLQSLRTRRDGMPFRKDTWDLFGSLFLSLKIGNRKQTFKTFAYAFTGQEALKGLASLKFVRSTSPGSKNATTSGTMQISLDEVDGAALMQYFLAGHMIKEARDDGPLPFSKKSIYQITTKGLRILEGFIGDNAIESEGDHLVAVLCTM